MSETNLGIKIGKTRSEDASALTAIHNSLALLKMGIFKRIQKCR